MILQSSLAALGIAGATPALAADQAAAAVGIGANSDIVVIARRREENSQDVMITPSRHGNELLSWIRTACCIASTWGAAKSTVDMARCGSLVDRVSPLAKDDRTGGLQPIRKRVR